MRAAFLLLLLLVPAAALAQFNYFVYNGTVTLTGYTGNASAVVIPDQFDGMPVTGIAGNAESGIFTDTTNVTSVTISTNVNVIGDWAFAACNLTNIILPDTVTNMGDWVFARDSGLASARIGNGVTAVGNYEFAACTNLAAVALGTNVGSIGVDAFDNCTTLPALALPDSVTNIGSWAFNYCTALTNLTLGAGLVSIGDFALVDCTHLTAFNVSSNNPAFAGVGGVLLDHTKTTLVAYPQGLSGVYTVPASVTNIAQAAFYSCSNLTGVVFGNQLANIGDYAFWSCTSLTNVIIPAAVTNLGNWAFQDCANLAGLYFLGDAPQAGDTAFDSDFNLITYQLPNAQGWDAFADNTGANVAYWPPQVQTIGSNYGASSNQLGFTINWVGGQNVVVLATTNLGNAGWTPLTNYVLAGSPATYLTGGSSTNFYDPHWLSQTYRTYRLYSP